MVTIKMQPSSIFRSICKLTQYKSDPTHLLLQNLGLQDTTFRGRLRQQGAKTPTYPVMCPFPLFIAPCDHNPLMLQTDKQTAKLTTD